MEKFVERLVLPRFTECATWYSTICAIYLTLSNIWAIFLYWWHGNL